MGKVFEVKEAAVAKQAIMEQIEELFGNDTILTVGSFKVAVPINGGWVQVAVSAPKGERGGSGWDPEAEAEAFDAEREAAAVKKAEQEKRKQAKIAKDEATRAAKAKTKEAADSLGE